MDIEYRVKYSEEILELRRCVNAELDRRRLPSFVWTEKLNPSFEGYENYKGYSPELFIRAVKKCFPDIFFYEGWSVQGFSSKGINMVYYAVVGSLLDKIDQQVLSVIYWQVIREVKIRSEFPVFCPITGELLYFDPKNVEFILEELKYIADKDRTGNIYDTEISDNDLRILKVTIEMCDNRYHLFAEYPITEDVVGELLGYVRLILERI